MNEQTLPRKRQRRSKASISPLQSHRALSNCIKFHLIIRTYRESERELTPGALAGQKVQKRKDTPLNNIINRGRVETVTQLPDIEFFHERKAPWLK